MNCCVTINLKYLRKVIWNCLAGTSALVTVQLRIKLTHQEKMIRQVGICFI